MKINFAKYFVKIISRKILAHVWRRKGGDASVKVVVVEPLRILSIWEQIDSRPPPNIVISPPWPIWQFKLHFRTFACCCIIANREGKIDSIWCHFLNMLLFELSRYRPCPRNYIIYLVQTAEYCTYRKGTRCYLEKLYLTASWSRLFLIFFYQIFSIV